MKKAISLLSGGLDCCVATSVYDKDYNIHALTFDYGQKAFKQELKASKNICIEKKWQHEIVKLPWLGKISDSSLNTNRDVPTINVNDLDDLKKSSKNASNVWVPGRNTVFTSIALSYAETINADIIIVGWNSEEGMTFPDNSKDYLTKFNQLLEVGSPDNIEIKAPCIDLTKEEIVELGLEVNAPMNLSYSCYKGEDEPCGVCESCMRRRRAFEKVCIKDNHIPHQIK